MGLDKLSQLELEQILEVMAFHRVTSGYLTEVGGRVELTRTPNRGSKLILREEVVNELRDRFMP